MNMPIICRLLKPIIDHENLNDINALLSSAKEYSDVYRYWHAIHYLLNQHTSNIDFLMLGNSLANANNTIPAARLIPNEQIIQFHQLIQYIEPDDLIPYYDAEQLDAAFIYPECWVYWEETFDPLGQILEHYFFLQQFVKHCALDNACLLLYFEFLDDGSDD